MLPSERDFAVQRFQFEISEARQDTLYLTDNELVSLAVFVFQTQENRRQIPAMRAHKSVIVFIPFLFDKGMCGGIVELIGHAIFQ